MTTHIKKYFQTFIRTSKIAFAAFLLLSCEGISHADGIVLSSDTRTPLDSVELIFNEDRHTTIVSDTIFTDKFGRFQIAHMSMCTPKCPNSTLIFSKKGFASTTINFDNQILDTTLTVIMTPIK